MGMNNDTLENTAHTFGITDVEFEDRELILKVLASLPLTEAKVAERKTSNAKGFGVRAQRFEEALEDCEPDFEAQLAHLECNEAQAITEQTNAMVIANEPDPSEDFPFGF